MLDYAAREGGLDPDMTAVRVHIAPSAWFNPAADHHHRPDDRARVDAEELGWKVCP